VKKEERRLEAALERREQMLQEMSEETKRLDEVCLMMDWPIDLCLLVNVLVNSLARSFCVSILQSQQFQT